MIHAMESNSPVPGTSGSLVLGGVERELQNVSSKREGTKNVSRTPALIEGKPLMLCVTSQN